MRLIKMFGLAALAAAAAMAFVGATSASASASGTQLCTTHLSLFCTVESGSSEMHMTLSTGTVGKLLSSLVTILCLGLLMRTYPLSLGQPQSVHTSAVSFTGCGTSSTHSNCSVLGGSPLFNALKTGLDTGSLTATNGELWAYCPNLGLDCVFDYEGMLLSMGAQHLTMNETSVTELSGDFFCPNQGKLDGLLTTLTNTYVLQ